VEPVEQGPGPDIDDVVQRELGSFVVLVDYSLIAVVPKKLINCKFS
jgi:hypothetical protein